MKILSKIAYLVIITSLITVFAFLCGYQARHYPEPFTVTDRVKALQRRVGCEKIDAVIGPETMRKVNTAVKAEKEAEERELFNSYARPYFTESGGRE